MCGLHADLTEWNECLAAGKADQIEGFHRDRRLAISSFIFNSIILCYIHRHTICLWLYHINTPTFEVWGFITSQSTSELVACPARLYLICVTLFSPSDVGQADR